MATPTIHTQAEAAVEFAHKAEQLSFLARDDESDLARQTTAVEAKFITPLDPVVETASGERLPAIPLDEALKLNQLKEEVEGLVNEKTSNMTNTDEAVEDAQLDPVAGINAQASTRSRRSRDSVQSTKAEAPLRRAIAPSKTNPLFPPLPLYGPSSFSRDMQCLVFRFTSFFLSLGFLAVIVLGSAFTSIPLLIRHIWLVLLGKDVDAYRPFIKEERRRAAARKEAESSWKQNRRRRESIQKIDNEHMERSGGYIEEFIPTEGGPDPLICDVGYYARRVGLDVEEFRVQTEDGFIIYLWHVYNPREYTPLPLSRRGPHQPEIFHKKVDNIPPQKISGKRKYPVLMMHGLLQSAGAYCTNDDDSLAFYLCKQGYDVWLGNNRCGFHPEHTLLEYKDPRMWAWNIRQMGVMDLPALVSRVLAETDFPKLGLICHSQGTTETFVALAKEQRPDLGPRISVFCALAPAVYAGPLIGKMYFKFMRVISPGMFRIFFGIHAFIPFMMDMHRLLPGRLYGALGYRVFSFLFNWTDDRWERSVRDRCFQFAPVYVSAESMRWWLGRECFAKQKCILATKEQWRQEEREDEEEAKDSGVDKGRADGNLVHAEEPEKEDSSDSDSDSNSDGSPSGGRSGKGSTAWYDEKAPPMALWVCGNDDLVDGRRLIRRFERGREPHVRIVHSKVIDEYEHLDVLWAMDSIEKVGREVKEVIWKTASEEVWRECRVPKGCETLIRWTGGSDGEAGAQGAKGKD
jgi:pimeloyl-ACP methyl ester carboxylesterase